MPCGCRKCDCSDQTLCLLIRNRLNTLAVVFENIADGLISIDQPYVLTFDDMTIDNYPVCLNFGQLFLLLKNPSIIANPSYSASWDSILGNSLTFGETYKLYCKSTNLGLFEISDSVVPSNFIPESPVNPGDPFLSAPLCIPIIDPNNPACLTCSPIQICLTAVVGVNNNPLNLINYAAISQNLRSVVDILC